MPCVIYVPLDNIFTICDQMCFWTAEVRWAVCAVGQYKCLWRVHVPLIRIDPPGQQMCCWTLYVSLDNRSAFGQ
jgi:hypothetical protein